MSSRGWSVKLNYRYLVSVSVMRVPAYKRTVIIPRKVRDNMWGKPFAIYIFTTRFVRGVEHLLFAGSLLNTFDMTIC